MQKTNFAFEVLVHDDASTDHTVEIIREYESKYPDIIKPIYQTENQYSQKIPITKTFLLPKAKGKYIAFCEGDDFWIDDRKLQLQYDAMEAHPECSACFCRVSCCNEDGSVNPRIIPELPIHAGVLTQYEVIKYWFSKDRPYLFQTSSYFFRKETVQYSYLAGYRKYMNGDIALIYSSIEKGQCFYVDETLSCYRLMSKGSWSEIIQKKTKMERIERVCRKRIGELLFDKSMNNKYHDIIFPGVKPFLSYGFGQIAVSGSKRDIIEFLGRMDISFLDFIKYFDNKNKCRVIMICYLPHLWRFYQKCRGKS